jgi:hypothetical protein
MLTYRLGTSTRGLVDAALAWGIVLKRLMQRVKEAQQTKSGFMGFVVGKVLSEFFAIYDFELLDRLAAQLAWRFHVIYITRAVLFEIDGGLCRFRQTRLNFARTCIFLIYMS